MERFLSSRRRDLRKSERPVFSQGLGGRRLLLILVSDSRKSVKLVGITARSARTVTTRSSRADQLAASADLGQPL